LALAKVPLAAGKDGKDNTGTGSSRA
jgi:hypothetical protein